MSRFSTPRLIWSAVLVATVVPTQAFACTVCMGDPTSNMAGAANGAIFLMLGFVGGMLSLLGAFAFYLVRRANSPLPPHAEFVSTSAYGDGKESHA